MRPPRILAAAAALLLPALTFAADDAPRKHAALTPEAETLLEADRAFAELSASSNARTAFERYLADNALMLPRSGVVLEGYDAAVESLGDGSGYRLLWQPAYAEVADSGELGWTWGRWQLWVDGSVTTRGKYVNIWTRDADGNWKVRMDMGNAEPEPATDVN